MQRTKLFIAVIGTLFALPTLAGEAAVTQHKEGVHAIPASVYTFTSNVTLISDYLYRGISQTGQKPALQGGFDFASAGGIYAGVWASNISWLSDAGVAENASLEIDTYVGFKSTFATDFSYDVGYLRYNYPGTYAAGTTKADTDEIYGLIGYRWVTAKYSHSLGKTFGMPDAKGTSYIDVSASFPIADTGITLGAHIGKQTYKGSAADAFEAAGANATYTDYKLSVSKDFSGFILGLAYSDTNAKGGPGQFYTNLQGKNLGSGTTVVSLSRSF